MFPKILGTDRVGEIYCLALRPSHMPYPHPYGQVLAVFVGHSPKTLTAIMISVRHSSANTRYVRYSAESVNLVEDYYYQFVSVLALGEILNPHINIPYHTRSSVNWLYLQYSKLYAIDCNCRKYLHFFGQNRNHYNKSLVLNLFREVTKMLINPVQ